MNNQLSLLFVVFLTAILPAATQACSCIEMPIKDQVRSAEKIVVGLIESKEVIPEEHEVNIKMKVLQNLKGHDKEYFNFKTGSNGAICGFNFQKGKEYLVYAKEIKSNKQGSGAAPTYKVSLCSRTKPHKDSKEEIEALKSILNR